MSRKPTLKYTINKDRSNGFYYITLVRGNKLTGVSKHGSFKSRRLAKQKLDHLMSEFLAKIVEGEIMADMMQEKLDAEQAKQLDCISFRKNHPDARLPTYASELAAGADVFAVISNRQSAITIEPNQHMLIRTGIELAHMDDSYELQIRPRSGLALKHGITVLNAPGTIDPDYRGEIEVILLNASDKPFVVRTGERIAQLVAVKRYPVFFTYAEEVTPTRRTSAGFGSTGI